MIDVKLPLRKAYYQLLKDTLTYNGVIVPVSTDIKKLADNDKPNYVIITGQTGNDTSTFSTFDSQETITIQVVSKAKTRVDLEIVDNICSQILGKVLPYPNQNGLIPQIGIQIDCVQLQLDRYLDIVINNGNTANRRILQFTQKVHQFGNNTVPAPSPLFQPEISSMDFYDATQYINPALNNAEYNIYLNGSKFLKEGTEWMKLTGGGFRILLNNFDATVNDYDIYIILK